MGAEGCGGGGRQGHSGARPAARRGLAARGAWREGRGQSAAREQGASGRATHVGGAAAGLRHKSRQLAAGRHGLGGGGRQGPAAAGRRGEGRSLRAHGPAASRPPCTAAGGGAGSSIRWAAAGPARCARSPRPAPSPQAAAAARAEAARRAPRQPGRARWRLASPGHRRGRPEHAADWEPGHGDVLRLEPVPQRRARGPRPEQLHGDAGLRGGGTRGDRSGPRARAACPAYQRLPARPPARRVQLRRGHTRNDPDAFLVRRAGALHRAGGRQLQLHRQ
jgi:hypothetical protein